MTTIPQFARKHTAPEPIEVRREQLRTSLLKMNLPEEVVEGLVVTCKENEWVESINGHDYVVCLEDGKLTKSRLYSIDEAEEYVLGELDKLYADLGIAHED